MQTSGDLKLVEIPTDDNGTEVLWADAAEGHARLISVPVFIHGVSRGALIATESHGARARFVQVLEPSLGATIRCYAAQDAKASELYTRRIFPDAQGMGLGIGPATFFDPDIVALHVVARAQVPAVTAFLDILIQQDRLRFWEVGDPQMDLEARVDADVSPSPWELVHQLPVEGQANVAAMC